MDRIRTERTAYDSKNSYGGINMFQLDKKEEEKAKVFMKAIKKPHTKFLPVLFEGNIYNARIIQEAYKKLMKRGTDTYITRITKEEFGGIIAIHFRTGKGKGAYHFKPIYFGGFTPVATTLHPIDFI
jgi:hypothetical protein